MIPRAQLQAWSRLSAQLVQIGFFFATLLSLIGTASLIVSIWGWVGGQWGLALRSGVVGAVALPGSFFVNALVRMVAAMFELLLDIEHNLDQRSASEAGVSYGLDD